MLPSGVWVGSEGRRVTRRQQNTDFKPMVRLTGNAPSGVQMLCHFLPDTVRSGRERGPAILRGSSDP